jgi:hypothetical protein
MYDDAIDTIEHNGYVIHVVVRNPPANPRDFMGTDSTILCREHNRYELGDEQSDAGSPEEMQAEIQAAYGPTRVMLPVWFYDHSVQAMSVRSFVGRAQHAEWDSAWAGFIFMTDEEIRRVYGVQRITAKLVAEVEKNLAAQVEVYSEYLSGNVFGYIIYDPADMDEPLDSCFGYYGFNDVDQAARAQCDELANDRELAYEAAKA